MKRLKMVLQLLTIIFLIICLCSCGVSKSTKTVILYDYKNLVVPSDVYEVSSEDVAFAVRMSLLEKEVTVDKQENFNLAENEDVLFLSININETESYQTQICLGDEEFGENIDKLFIGKSIGDMVNFVIEDDTYNATIESIKKYAEEVTDDIAEEYYKMDSAEEVVEYIRNDIARHRKFEYAYERLLNESTIKINYDEKTDYINERIKYQTEKASQNNVSIDTYITDVFGYTVEEYREALELFYDEYNILKHVITNENVEISQEEFNRYLVSIADSYEMTPEELVSEQGEEFIYYNVYYDLCYSILLQYI